MTRELWILKLSTALPASEIRVCSEQSCVILYYRYHKLDISTYLDISSSTINSMFSIEILGELKYGKRALDPKYVDVDK